MTTTTLFRYGKSLFNQQPPKRAIYHWLTKVFNQVDQERIKNLGPDRVCAEWCLRNGASVKWIGIEDILDNYNVLPPEGAKLFVEKIFADGATISHDGFLHLRNCKFINEIILEDCGYIENSALKQLSFVKDSLKKLRVSKCQNITEAGLHHLEILKTLTTLEIFKLPYIKEGEKVISSLRQSLPKCNIISDFEKNNKANTEK